MTDTDQLEQVARLRSAQDRANRVTALIATLETQLETMRERHARAVAGAYDDPARLDFLARSAMSQLVNELRPVADRCDRRAI